MKLGRVLLEEWMRMYYFAVDIDIGSSGVENYSMGELRRMLGIRVEEIDGLVLRDSESLGGRGVRSSIAARWTGGDVERVLVTHGSSEALFLAMETLLEPGDEVVVLDPCYPQHRAITEAAGCRLKGWPLRFERGFRPDLDEALDLIGPQTRMVVVNFPHNPTGATLTGEEQEALLARIEEVGAYLVWDGAFTDLTYGESPLPDPCNRYDRTLSIGTLSKACGLPGLRVGWCLSSPEILRRLITTRDHVTLHLSPLVELVAQKVIEHAGLVVGQRREQAVRNLALLEGWVAEHADRLTWATPHGGVCAFVKFDPALDVEALCHRLARERRVLLVPGSCFDRPDCARFGFGDSTGSLQEGLARLSELLRV